MPDEVSITMQEVKNLKKDAESEISKILQAFETRTGLHVEDINYENNSANMRSHAFIHTKLK